MSRDSFLSDDCPPMGIYEPLYAFQASFGPTQQVVIDSLILERIEVHQLLDEGADHDHADTNRNCDPADLAVNREHGFLRCTFA